MDRNSKTFKTLILSLMELSNEYYDLHPSAVSVVEGIPLPVEFLRRWLSPNIPVIFKNAVKHWPALTKWSDEYLWDKLKGNTISVAVTPNGYADSILNDTFVMPEEKSMTFRDFTDTLCMSTPTSPVHYIQKQNSNFINEFSALHDDVDLHIPWASEAMGRQPDAVNFWMGDGRAITSMHKDHYENIYCVVRGKKEFILHPPIDVPWIPYGNYESGIYDNVGIDNAIIHYKSKKVKWISIDPLNPDYEKYPLYRNARQFHCTVEEGDALYLPALWFHHVRQSHGCIAVNYWYDMDFNAKYCHFKFLENMSNLIHGTS